MQFNLQAISRRLVPQGGSVRLTLGKLITSPNLIEMSLLKHRNLTLLSSEAINKTETFERQPH